MLILMGILLDSSGLTNYGIFRINKVLLVIVNKIAQHIKLLCL